MLAPIRVTSLGYWDEGGNGLVDDDDVGLWTSAGDLVAQATVTDASPNYRHFCFGISVAGSFSSGRPAGPERWRVCAWRVLSR